MGDPESGIYGSGIHGLYGKQESSVRGVPGQFILRSQKGRDTGFDSGQSGEERAKDRGTYRGPVHRRGAVRDPQKA